MRDFSKELVEDRQFVIGGELFEWRYPYWEEFANLREQIAQEAARAQSGELDNGDSDFTFVDLYKQFIDRIEIFLDPKNDALKRWRALSKRKVDPVPAYQYSELYQWLIGVVSDRPTETLLSSSNGQERTEAMSTEGSS